MRFDKPVKVAITPLGNVAKDIHDASDAADVLLNRWHGRAGAKHLAARKAVLRAMENAHDHVLAERARKAFEAAAKDADLLVNPPPKSVAPASFKTPNWRRR